MVGKILQSLNRHPCLYCQPRNSDIIDSLIKAMHVSNLLLFWIHAYDAITWSLGKSFWRVPPQFSIDHQISKIQEREKCLWVCFECLERVELKKKKIGSNFKKWRVKIIYLPLFIEVEEKLIFFFIDRSKSNRQIIIK